MEPLAAMVVVTAGVVEVEQEVHMEPAERALLVLALIIPQVEKAAMLIITLLSDQAVLLLQQVHPV
jgi:hypothetical protein